MADAGYSHNMVNHTISRPAQSVTRSLNDFKGQQRGRAYHPPSGRPGAAYSFGGGGGGWDAPQSEEQHLIEDEHTNTDPASPEDERPSEDWAWKATPVESGPIGIDPSGRRPVLTTRPQPLAIENRFPVDPLTPSSPVPPTVDSLLDFHGRPPRTTVQPRGKYSISDLGGWTGQRRAPRIIPGEVIE